MDTVQKNTTVNPNHWFRGEEAAIGSFHTPRLSLAHRNSNNNILTSQDSLDVFHDAPSSLQVCSEITEMATKIPPGSLPRAQKRIQDSRKIICRMTSGAVRSDKVEQMISKSPSVDDQEGIRNSSKINSNITNPTPDDCSNDSTAKVPSVVDGWDRNYVPFVDQNSSYFTRLQGNPQPIDGTMMFYSQIQPIAFKTYKKSEQKTTLSKIKEEFALANFKFNHRESELFVKSQWQQDEMCCMYFAYRLFWGLYFVMWSVWSWVGFAGYHSPPLLKLHYLLYLTDWAIWILAFDTMLQAVNVGFHIRRCALRGPNFSKMKRSFKASWILSNLTSTVHVFITIMFWTTIYSPQEYSFNTIVFNTRIVPCAYVIIDSLISATPRRIFHAYLPMMLLTIYGIATDIYYLAGGTNYKGETGLYPILDWSEPLQTLLFGSGLILILIPLIHILVICALSGFRGALHKSLKSVRYEPIDSNERVILDAKL